MDRRVTPPKQVTSSAWGPPPPCQQALHWQKQQLCTCITFFGYISLPSLQDYEVNVPNFTFFGGLWAQDNDCLFLFLNFYTIF